MTVFEKAWETCIPVRKDMGLVRPGDEVDSPGRLYIPGRQAPECFQCGKDVYETDTLESCHAQGDWFYFCEDHEEEAAWKALDSCRGPVSLAEGRDSFNME